VLALRASGNYTVDWGDGSTTAVSSPGEVIQPNTYWFANNFYGPLERMSLANPGDNHWIKRIEGSLVAYRNGVILDPSAYRVEVNPSTNNVELVLTPPVPDGEYAGLQVRWEWGETVIEPIKAEHRYSYEALPASSQCSRGYRQVLVTLTAQSGEAITAGSEPKAQQHRPQPCLLPLAGAGDQPAAGRKRRQPAALRLRQPRQRRCPRQPGAAGDPPLRWRHPAGRAAAQRHRPAAGLD